MSFGGFQPGKSERQLTGHREGKNYRYQCDLCGSPFISDEALQLHKLGHIGMAQTEVIRQGFEQLIEMISRKLEA